MTIVAAGEAPHYCYLLAYYIVVNIKPSLSGLKVNVENKSSG